MSLVYDPDRDIVRARKRRSALHGDRVIAAGCVGVGDGLDDRRICAGIPTVILYGIRGAVSP